MNPKTGKSASVTNPETWSNFEEACDAMQHWGHIGIGFVLTEEDPIIVIDIDHCRECGEWDSRAATVLDRLDTYAETSVSGTGLHLVLKAPQLQLPRKRLGGVEVYRDNRFIAITGHVVNDRGTIEDCSAAFHAWYQTILGEHQEGEHTGYEELPAAQDGPVVPSIQALLESHPGFVRLFAFGDLASYRSHSEADLAMLSITARAGITDPAELDLIMRQSRLMRDKWNRADYREPTIQKALGSITFNPTASRHTAAEPLDVSDLKEEIERLRIRIEIQDRAAELVTWQTAIQRNKSLKNVATTAICLVRKFFHFEERQMQPPYRLSIQEITEATGRTRVTIAAHLELLVKAGLLTTSLVPEPSVYDSERQRLLPPRIITYMTPNGTALEFAKGVAFVQLPRKQAAKPRRSQVQPGQTLRCGLTEMRAFRSKSAPSADVDEAA